MEKCKKTPKNGWKSVNFGAKIIENEILQSISQRGDRTQAKKDSRITKNPNESERFCRIYEAQCGASQQDVVSSISMTQTNTIGLYILVERGKTTTLPFVKGVNKRIDLLTN